MAAEVVRLATLSRFLLSIDAATMTAARYFDEAFAAKGLAIDEAARYEIINKRFDLPPEVDRSDDPDNILDDVVEPISFDWFEAVDDAMVIECELRSQLASGTLLLHLDGMLQDFSLSVTGNRLEYKLHGPMIGSSQSTEGVPFGSVLWAAANNVRHFREWQLVDEPARPLALWSSGPVTEDWAFEQFFGTTRDSLRKKDDLQAAARSAFWQTIRQPMLSIYVLQRALESANWISAQVSFEILRVISRDKTNVRLGHSVTTLWQSFDHVVDAIVASADHAVGRKFIEAKAFMQRLAARRTSQV